jgi:hypothetical protein
MIDLINKLFSEGFIYIFIYLLLFVFVILESLSDYSRYKYYLFYFSCTILFFFTALRWETGTDWFSYKNLFDEVSLNFDEVFFLQIYSFDFGYVFLNIFIKYLSNSYTLLLVIDSFIALALVYLFIKKYSPKPNISIFLFYNAFFVAQYMGSNRRIIAIGLILFVFAKIIRKKKVWIYQIIAFLFHKSSMIGLLSFCIPKKRIPYKKIFLLLFLSVIIGYFQLTFKMLELISMNLSNLSGFSIIDKLNGYTVGSEQIELGARDPILMMVLSTVKRLVFLIFYLLIIRTRIGILDNITDFFFNIYVTGFALYLLLNGSEVIQVLSSYFTFIEIVLIGRFWNYANSKQKNYFLPILFIYGFFQLVSSLNAYPELYIPYKSVFL